MTSVTEFSRKLAKSFYLVLSEVDDKPNYETYLKELTWVSELAAGEAEAFFLNPTFTDDEKFGVFAELAEKEKISNPVLRLVETVIETGHFADVPGLCHAFAEVMRDRQDRALIKVRSAYPISAEKQKALETAFGKMTQKEVDLQMVEDKSLIGGIRAELGGVVFDASVSGLMNRLKEEIRQ